MRSKHCGDPRETVSELRAFHSNRVEFLSGLVQHSYTKPLPGDSHTQDADDTGQDGEEIRAERGRYRGMRHRQKGGA